jgi:uncharacterized Zn finger protein
VSDSWSAQFMGMFESLGLGARFQRGRRYARIGNVVSLTISASLVVALVRGDDDKVYRARLALRAFSNGDWAAVERDLARQAFFTAKLLSGQLPPEIEAVFVKHKLRLFPDTLGELALDCNCPSWDVPCEHLTAACYVLADSFDTDPFGILAWRGRSREELLHRLHQLRGLGSGAPAPPATSARKDPPLPFFGVPDLPRAPVTRPAVPGTIRRPDALLDEAEPLIVNGIFVTEQLRPLYRRLAD